MNRPHPTRDSRVEQIHARLEILGTERANASATLARVEKAVTELLASRSRPPRELRRALQRDRDRVKTRLAAIEVEVRQLQEGRYVLQHPNGEGRYWIPQMKLFLGTWQGTCLGTTTLWLRWWDEAGNLLLWSSEKAEREH